MLLDSQGLRKVTGKDQCIPVTVRFIATAGICGRRQIGTWEVQRSRLGGTMLTYS